MNDGKDLHGERHPRPISMQPGNRKEVHTADDPYGKAIDGNGISDNGMGEKENDSTGLDDPGEITEGKMIQDVDAMIGADAMREWEEINTDKYEITDLLKCVDEALVKMDEALNILREVDGDHVEYYKVGSYADDLQSMMNMMAEERRREFR